VIDGAEKLYQNECQLEAYLRYYFFLNYPVIKWILLKNLEKGTNIIPDGLINVLDYGAGPGTASRAICDFLKEAKESGVYQIIRLKLDFDEKAVFSGCYRKMLSGQKIASEVNYVYEKDDDYKSNFYDLVMASYVLNELSNEDRDRFLEQAYRCLKSGGYLILVESAYEYARECLGCSLNLTRGSFKIIDASGPLCFNRDCTLWTTCYRMSIKRKDLRTPAGMTAEMKRFLEVEKSGKTRWVHLVLRKEKSVFVDPSRVEECIGRRAFVTSGWVIEKDSTENAENIWLCNGLGCCNLAFWRDREVLGHSEDISVCDRLTIEGEYRGHPFDNLPSVNVIRVIELIKKM
jgi:phospholipid N-methyltransferase